MSIPFAPAAHTFEVQPNDRPVFNGHVVHEVCSTYALAREFEWAGRRVYLATMPPNTEAIGTQLEVVHKAAAPVGSILHIVAEPISYANGWLLCKCTALLDTKQVAEGTTTQKIRSAKKVL